MERLIRIVRYLLNILIPVAGWILLCVLGPKLLRFFLPFVVGWILAMIANPLVNLLEKHLRIARGHSSVLIVVLVLGGLIALIYAITVRIAAESIGLLHDLPQLYSTAKAEVAEALGKADRLLGYFPLSVREMIDQFGENLGSYLSSLMEKVATPTVTAAGNVAKGIPSALVNIVIVVLSSYFFIAEREKIMTEARRRTPRWIRRYMVFLRADARRLVGGYFLAQFKIMFVVAVVLAVGFFVMKVEYGVLLAALIAFLDFLPVFGTGTALMPWALVKLLSGEYGFAAGLLLLYVLTQVVRQVVQPKIVGDTMGLPPLTTLFLLYLGFKVQGITGMILAVPAGLLVGSLYRHGAFDAVIENGRLLIGEIQGFRRGE